MDFRIWPQNAVCLSKKWVRKPENSPKNDEKNILEQRKLTHLKSVKFSLRMNFGIIAQKFFKKIEFTPKSLVLNKIWLRILGFLTDSIEKAWIRMFWSIKIIRIGPKPSKIAKYILGRLPSFFRFILENLIFRGFFNFLVALLEGIFEISPDRPCSPP